MSGHLVERKIELNNFDKKAQLSLGKTRYSLYSFFSSTANMPLSISNLLVNYSNRGFISHRLATIARTDL